MLPLDPFTLTKMTNEDKLLNRWSEEEWIHSYCVFLNFTKVTARLGRKNNDDVELNVLGCRIDI